MTENTASTADDEPVYEYSIAQGESASTAVLLFVSDIVDTPIEELPSLTSIVDTEHLDGLCKSFPENNGHVSFQYHEFEVTIRSDETLELQRSDG